MIDYTVVLDENERAQMLADGYRPEVIDFIARDRYDQLVADFKLKNFILGTHFQPTPYFDFVASVFPDLEKLMVITADVGYQEMDIDELVDYQAERDDVYVPPVSFINGHNSAASCRDVYALVIDIDKIHPDTLRVIIENENLGKTIPQPTYVVNSGRGVHFYYVFEKPVPHYYANRAILKAMYTVLCGITKKNILAKTDWHAITQPFRLPGSRTRLDQVATGWKSGDKWPAKLLAKRLGVDAEKLDLRKRPLLSQKEYHEEQARRAAEADSSGDKPKKKKRKTVWKSSLEGNTAFYLSCLERCYEETAEGTRFYSMCALTTVAKKCGYPKEQLEQDLIALFMHYNTIGKRMKSSEIKKAMRMYNDKALRTKSETLEVWFGWEFGRDNQKKQEKKKEKGTYVKRTRAEICERARKIRDIDYPDGAWINKEGRPKGVGTKEEEIQAWRAAHPEGKPKDCIEQTGISKNTVYKWWKSCAPTENMPVQEDENVVIFYEYTPDGVREVRAKPLTIEELVELYGTSKTPAEIRKEVLQRKKEQAMQRTTQRPSNLPLNWPRRTNLKDR